MDWPPNSLHHGHLSISYPRNKAAHVKLLEVLRFENPILNVVALPALPVACGKNKLKFPDPNNDCFVNLSLAGRTARVSLPVHYDYEKSEELEEDENPSVGHVHGLWYSLQLVSTARYSLAGEKLPTELPEKSYYCCCPVTDQRKTDHDSNKNDIYGFWFRLFSEETRFHFMIGLKLEGIDVLSKECKNNTYLSSIIRAGGHVCTIEFDICTTARHPELFGNDKKSKAPIAVARHSKNNLSVLHLYSNEKYKKLIKSVQELKFEAKYENLENLLSHASARYQADFDLKVVVLLEQGLVACRKRFCDYAKELFKNAVDLVGRCRNKSLLTGRIYVYLSEVHFNEGFIGNAGESLIVARKYLEAFGLCEDLGDLCFHEALILMVHAKRMPVFLRSLIPEAREKFLDAVNNFSEGKSIGEMTDKLNCSYVKLASLELQPMPGSEKQELVVTEEQVARAKSYLKKVERDFESLSQQTKLYYYLCLAELCLELKQVNEANKKYNKALSLAKSIGLQNYVHVDIALEEVRRCLENDLIVMEKPQNSVQQDKEMSEGATTDNLDGYLGDESADDI